MASATITATHQHIPPSAEVAAYERGLAAGKRAGRTEAPDGHDKEGFFASLLEDLLQLIELSPGLKKKQLTAQTKVPTMETVVAADAAADAVTAGYYTAYKMRKTDKDAALEMQNKAVTNFLGLDPLVREGALLVLYVRAEEEYTAHQLHAAQYQNDLAQMQSMPEYVDR